jgi:hypothetical protein
MRGLQRKSGEAAAGRPSPFFRPQVQRTAAGAPFFHGPVLQRQENKEEEKKDPLTEGLKTTGEQLAEHKPFKDWYEPRLNTLKLTLWDKASPADKAAMLTFLGLNLGVGATAFAVDPKIRSALSGVNIGKPLGWIPYSPVEGFKYTLPEQGKSEYGFSADFTLNPYLDLLRKRHSGLPLTGATFGLESSYDPAGKGLSLTGGKFGLDFFGGGLRQDVQGSQPVPAVDSRTRRRRAGLVADAGSARHAEDRQARLPVHDQRGPAEAVSATEQVVVTP